MKIKLATRTSALALFQAEQVHNALQRLSDIQTEIVGIQTKGDKDQNTALQHLGQTGIFTKSVDDAVLDGRADVGVHSLKDYPTQMPEGLMIYALLPRDGQFDVFVPGTDFEGLEYPLHLLSGSPRRKAQWWSRYPEHTFGDLRGNMDTRLAKMGKCGGGIVSGPGLKRLGMLPNNAIELDWMIPAPAQGIMAVIGRVDRPELAALFAKINDQPTFRCATVERQFMSAVEAGCASPLGALAVPYDDQIRFHGALLSLDGSRKIEIQEDFAAELWPEMGRKLADQLLERGGRELMEEIRSVQPADVLYLKPIGPETRKEALDVGLKLHDLEVLDLQPVDFACIQAEAFAVGSAFGAAQLESHIHQLPDQAFVIGQKATTALRTMGYEGEITTFECSEELHGYWIRCGKPNWVYYGAANSRMHWSAEGWQHVVTYENRPTQPRLARQEWDAIAAFSPLGIQSACSFNDFNKKTPVVCIGKATATACKELGFEHIIIAPLSSQKSIIQRLSNLLS